MRFLFLALAALGAAIAPAACSSSSTPSAPAQDAGLTDAGPLGNDGATSEGGDAGSYEQDPNVYPSTHTPLPLADNLGGRVLDHPRIVTVTFTGDTMRDPLRGFAPALSQSKWWTSTVGSYGIAPATNTSVEVADTFGTATIKNADFKAWIVQQVLSGALPAPDAQTFFLIYIPHTLSIDVGVLIACGTSGGYHDHTFVTLPTAGDGGVVADAGAVSVDVPFAVVPRCPNAFLATETVFAGGQIAATLTDPFYDSAPGYRMKTNDAWRLKDDPYGEIDALCIGMLGGDAFVNSTYQTERAWSNAAAAASKDPCQPSTQPYFNAAARTPANGRLSVKRGTSVEVIIDFFSEAPLSADPQLSVGTFVNGASALGKLPPGVTATLSRTTAHNGNAIVMTMAVAANAVIDDVRMSVRSKLSVWNDWPFIVMIE